MHDCERKFRYNARHIIKTFFIYSKKKKQTDLDYDELSYLEAKKENMKGVETFHASVSAFVINRSI